MYEILYVVIKVLFIHQLTHIRERNNALPDDGITVTPKHVGAVLMQILIFLRQLTGVSVGE